MRWLFVWWWLFVWLCGGGCLCGCVVMIIDCVVVVVGV